MAEFFSKPAVQRGLWHGFLAGLGVTWFLAWRPSLTSLAAGANPATLELWTRMFLGLLVDGMALGVMFLLGLLIIAQFVLPVQTMRERREVFSHLLDYAFGNSGPILFVKDGNLVSRKEELKQTGRGLVLLDAVSAIVLERSAAPLGWFHRPDPEAEMLSPTPGGPPLTRAAGPGLVFMDPGERIIATLDLRRHSRSGPTQAHTREGLEVSAIISVAFGLTPPPAKPEAPPPPTAPAVHPTSRPPLTNIFKRKDKPAEAETSEAPAERVERNLPAYPFNPTSAFRAVYGMAVKDQYVEPWTELPLRVAQEHFRNRLAESTLDELFQPTQAGVFPYADFQAEVLHLVKTDPVLRERGLTIYSVVIVNFTLPREVQNQRIRSWQTRWQKARLQHEAASAAQTIRTEGRRRAEAQELIFADIQHKLAATEDPIVRRALALTLMKALQRAAADPATRTLLPTETLQVLDNYPTWLK